VGDLTGDGRPDVVGKPCEPERHIGAWFNELFLAASVEYVNQLVPSPWRATGQSLFWAAHMGIGAILGNTLAGFFYDRLGVQGMYRLSSLFILAVALAMRLTLKVENGS